MTLTYACRPEPHHHGHVPPASAYVREQRLLGRYRDLLYGPETDVEQLMRAVWGEALTRRQMYGSDTKDGRVDRLDHNLPELLQRLRWDEQAEAEALLATDDLLGCVRLLLRLERNLLQRESDPRLKLNDDANARAAGLGRLSRQAYGRPAPLGPPLVLTPWPPTPARRVGPLRASHRRAPRRPAISPKQLCLFP